MIISSSQKNFEYQRGGVGQISGKCLIMLTDESIVKAHDALPPPPPPPTAGYEHSLRCQEHDYPLCGSHCRRFTGGLFQRHFVLILLRAKGTGTGSERAGLG